MNDHILVSIVTPSYNQGQFIEETIQSILNQSYPHIQYILIDGGSSDRTMDIVEKYRDRIDIVVHEKDNGQSDAINKGFRMATGELVGWINSDDVLYHDFVQKIVDLYKKHPDGAIFYGSKLSFINEESIVFEERDFHIKRKNDLLFKDYSVAHLCSFYRNEFLKKCNYLDSSICYCMDLDLWLRLLDLGNIYSVDKTPLAKFRIWSATKTTTGWKSFFKEIRYTLLKHGSKIYSHSILKSYWIEFKITVKTIFRK